jgi:hypothetical protein
MMLDVEGQVRLVHAVDGQQQDMLGGLTLVGQGRAGSVCQRQSQADGAGDAQDTYMCSEQGFLLPNGARSGASLPGPIRGDWPGYSAQAMGRVAGP